jgi:hypothetical protein
VAGTTPHEGDVELIPAVAMGIAINCYILFMNFSAGRSGGSTENPGKLLRRLSLLGTLMVAYFNKPHF